MFSMSSCSPIPCRGRIPPLGHARQLFGLLVLLVLVPQFAATAYSSQITLAWNANTETHLAGYKIHYGASSRAYTQSIDVGNLTTYSVTPLPNVQTTYFAVTAYDTHGQESGFSAEISWSADQSPSQPFTASQTSGPAPLAVTFTVTPPIDPSASYNWSFGDGATTSGTSVTHTYMAGGTYAATLTIPGDPGSPYTVTITVTSGSPGSDAPPVAVIQPDSVSGYTSSPVSLNGSGSYDPAGGAIVAWQWHLGDGTTKTGSQISHQYLAAGTYQAILTVTNDRQASTMTSIPVTIQKAPDEGEGWLKAVIRVSKKRGVSLLEYSFAGDQSQAEGADIVSYKWYFGDGTSAEGITATHTFDFEAEYMVTLHVTDSLGRVDETNTIIRAGSQSTPNLLPILQLLLLDD